MPAERANIHLVFRIGSLGDAVVALPAIRFTKESFPNDIFVLLTEDRQSGGIVKSDEIYRGMGLFDDVIHYDSTGGGKLVNRVINAIRLILDIRKRGVIRLTYLAPSGRTRLQRYRDWVIFRLAGVSKMYGFGGFVKLPAKKKGVKAPLFKREVDLLINRIDARHVVSREKISEYMNLEFNRLELEQFNLWLKNNRNEYDRKWIALAPFSNQRAKVWPINRYIGVVRRLIDETDCFPLLFGSAAERAGAQGAIEQIGRGYNMCGLFDARVSALVMKQCVMYLGADTGPIHLAAAVRIPCVGVYSAHGLPGRWHPYGEQNVIFRTNPDCELCNARVCPMGSPRCILDISEKDVYEACLKMMTHYRSI